MLDRLKRAFGGANRLPDAIDDSARRAIRLIEKGPHPEQVFLCAQAGGRLLTFQYPEQQGPSILLFSTGFYAADYLGVTGVEADVARFALGALPQLAKKWIQLGAATFVLNRCPRCSVAVVGSTENLLNLEGFLYTWATDRVSRAHKGEQLMRTAFTAIASGNLNAAMDALREIRNHVDCGIPQLYQLIAVHAELLGEEEEKATAWHRLKMFGAAYASHGDINARTVGKILEELLLHFVQIGR